MTILALDAAGSACSVAIWDQRAAIPLRARRIEPLREGQAQRLMPLILETLADAGIGFADLDRLAVTIGPGGFTGVRLGLAAARGLALATGLTLVGRSTLEVAAASLEAPDGAAIVAAIDSKRAEVFVQAFAAAAPDAPIARSAPAMCRPDELDARLPRGPGPVVVVGDAADLVAAALLAAGRGVADVLDGPVDPAVLARLAAAASATDEPLPHPLYLRPPDVTLPRAPLATAR